MAKGKCENCGKIANLRLYNSVVAQEMICEACYKKTNPLFKLQKGSLEYKRAEAIINKYF